MGNIWRFSYVAVENGGAVFLFIYIGFVLLVGLPLIIGELSLGRHAQGDAVAAFESAGNNRRWRLVGWLSVFGSILILSYYAVIAGWAFKVFLGRRDWFIVDDGGNGVRGLLQQVHRRSR